MTTHAIQHDSRTLIKPEARCAIHIRAATLDDLPFIDALQKMHSHMVGFLQRPVLTKYLEGGHVLIAQEQARSGPAGGSIPVGYIIAKDRYLHRDDVGIIFHLNVMPLRHRHLVGATLVKAAFDRAAYGCRLFSCWCAQDIQANYFWESIGFVPLAFRTGSRSKQRIHIFWQRRIRAGDEVTPYWFPSQTGNGAVGEDRIVLPIPPGTHWRDAKPLVLPGVPTELQQEELPRTLPGGQPVRPRERPEKPRLTRSQHAALKRSQSKHLGGAPIGKKAVIRGGRIRYIDIPGFDPATDSPDELIEVAKPKKPVRGPRQKHDPKYIAAARELRDKFLEQVNTGQILLGGECAKYDVRRQLEAAPFPGALTQRPLLDAA